MVIPLKQFFGTRDSFTYGGPSGILRNINEHTPTSAENQLAFIADTGHACQQKHQEVADVVLRLVHGWRAMK